jgi:hypothetical protein
MGGTDFHICSGVTWEFPDDLKGSSGGKHGKVLANTIFPEWASPASHTVKCLREIPILIESVPVFSRNWQSS